MVASVKVYICHSIEYVCLSLCQTEKNPLTIICIDFQFNEKLRDAVEINVLGTKKILDLVMGIKHLKVSIRYLFSIDRLCIISTPSFHLKCIFRKHLIVK